MSGGPYRSAILVGPKMENQLKNLNISDVEEVRDSVPNSSSSEVIPQQAGNSRKDHEGTGMNRSLSGAQRRKLLKQQAIAEGKPIPKFGEKRKERRRDEKRARTANNPDADPTLKPSGKRGASSSLELPTESDDKRVPKPLKKAKIMEGSYANVASNLPRVILTCGEYLRGRMPSEVITKIQEAVVGKVLAIDEGAFVPRFVESFPRAGTLVFVCEDKESEAWLERTADELDLGEPDLKVRTVAPEELKITKVMTWLPAGVKNASDFLKLVRRQNGGVDASKWAVLKETPEGCLILGLDEPSAATLKSRNLRLTAGVGTATFKLLHRNTAGKPEVEATE